MPPPAPGQPQFGAGYPSPYQVPYQPGWQPAPVPPAPAPQKASALPVVPREYHEFFRAPRFRWWKPILSLAMFAAIFLLLTLILPGIASVIDLASGRISLDDLNSGDPTRITRALTTPLGFTANNVALALSIPAASLTAWAVFRQRPRWMSSIAGGFRWGLLGRFVLVAAPVFALALGLDLALGGVPDLRWNSDSLFLIISVLITTPFQSAGEEYGVRGIIARSIGSWFSSRRLGLVVAAVATSLLFMTLHVADNIWLNTYYFSVGMICSVLVWRTGGLEAAVALHLCNNLISEYTLPFGGLENMFDRGPTSVGPEILFQLVFTLVVMAGMLWIAHRRALPRMAAPAAPVPMGPIGQPAVVWNSTQTIA